jgi:RIO kinase 1
MAIQTNTNSTENLDELDDAEFIAGNRARRDMKQQQAQPHKKKVDIIKRILREAKKHEFEADVDVFTPTFKGKKFEEEWLLSSLGGFYHNQLIADILSQVKGGKEANVYCCAAHAQLGVELLAAKVYRPRMFRNLKNDAQYRHGGSLIGADGKALRKERENRAVAKRTDFGLQTLHQSWLQNEIGVLTELHKLGANVPKPYAVSDNAILMTFLGERDAPATTLNHVRLDRREAKPLFDLVIDNVRLMLQNNIVHGDLSAYNIMYFGGEITLIDFPQATNPYRNPHAYEFFCRDVERVCQYFNTYDLNLNATHIAQTIWRGVLGVDGKRIGEIQKGRWNAQ